MRGAVLFLNPSCSLLRFVVEWFDACRYRNGKVSTTRDLTGSSSSLDIILGIDMAKGKKNLQRADNKPEDSVEHKVGSKDTKENTPANNKDSLGTLQSVSQPLHSRSKQRSPLSVNSSMLIQEGNESGVTNPDISKLKYDVPNETQPESCESKEKKSETALHRHGNTEETPEQQGQKVPTIHVKARSAAEGKVSASKPCSRPARKPSAKKTDNKAPQNRKVTDFFPIRRSNRKTKAELKNEEHRYIDDLIKSGTEEGLQVKHTEGKGRGIFAVKDFKKGDFVVEYHGDLLELQEAKMREALYAQDPQTGCYMYYFQFQAKTYCVDATKETSRLGRLINHSKTGNCQTKLHPIDGIPHLILVASRDIKAEEELLYDYGDRSTASILAHPWLKY